MTNIAQTINVLQAMILTKEEKMVLTPTYHVFEMFNVHQDATLLPSVLECIDYKYKEENVPSLSASASKDAAGNIHVSICNLNPNENAELDCEIRGGDFAELSARILTADKINAHNTFENPAVLEPKEYKGIKKSGSHILVNVPAKSVVVLKVK